MCDRRHRSEGCPRQANYDYEPRHRVRAGPGLFRGGGARGSSPSWPASSGPSKGFTRWRLEAPEPGGVGFRADRAGLYAANLHLRIASRVLVRIGTFHASAFHQLERQAARLPWVNS